MNKIERYQAYADKCAEKLGIANKIVIRWSGGICKCLRRQEAHCHLSNTQMPRGTICIKPGYWLDTVKQWHYLIAHEVSHLATKCSHSSCTFAKRMETLGQAGSYERDYLKTQRKHRHVYSLSIYRDGIKHFYCHYCRKEYCRKEKLI